MTSLASGRTLSFLKAGIVDSTETPTRATDSDRRSTPVQPQHSNHTDSTDKTDTFLDHAIAYARAKFRVLPLLPGQKVPATRHGKDDATTDLDVIRAWWARNSQYNIGIRPNPGDVVLDIDVRNGGTLESLGVLPSTWTAATGGGGYHLWFRCSGRMRGKLDRLPGIDLKTETGYLVAPPSVHPSGARYCWINDEPIVPMPGHLRGLARIPVGNTLPRRTVGRTSGDPLIRSVENAVPGQRNHLLFWAACRAHHEGSHPVVLDGIRTAAIGIGLTEREVDATMRSAARKSGLSA